MWAGFLSWPPVKQTSGVDRTMTLAAPRRLIYILVPPGSSSGPLAATVAASGPWLPPHATHAPLLGPPLLSPACLVNQRCFVPLKLHGSHTAVFPVFPVQTGLTASKKRLLTQWAATLPCHLGHESAGWDGSAQLG